MKSKNFSSFRLLTLCMLGFCGFIRYSEINNLGRSGETFHDMRKYFSQNAKLTISQRKLDIYD